MFSGLKQGLNQLQIAPAEEKRFLFDAALMGIGHSRVEFRQRDRQWQVFFPND